MSFGFFNDKEYFLDNNNNIYKHILFIINMRISEKIMNNPFFKDYFEAEAEDSLATSLSREGFLVRQATTMTKNVADITKRKKINKGWFGSKKVEESGGDQTSRN